MATISGSTIWRWLHQDAIRPSYHRSWIFPRDPAFVLNANRILDLHERSWQGNPLNSDEFVISADEKTSIQDRQRKHPTLPPSPKRPRRVEHEYDCCGAWAYIAALDVHHARVFGRCEATTGIAPFDRPVEQVMTRPPHNEARRVSWIVHNGSSHRGKASVARLKQLFRRLTPVHGPGQLAERLLAFQYSWESTAKPFQWSFTKADLATLPAKLSARQQIAA